MTDPTTDIIVATDLKPPQTMEATNWIASDRQIAVAHRYPRSLTRFYDLAKLGAERTVETASSMFYVLPAGKKKIEGGSIRLAEVVANAWGNAQYESTLIAVEESWVVARGRGYDAETNLSCETEVRKSILHDDGRTRFNAHMIRVTAAAACATALRNVILFIVPRVYWEEIMAGARKVAIGEASTLVSRRQDLVDYFGKMSVSPEQLCLMVDKRGADDIDLNDLLFLRGIATAIKDGVSSVDEVFNTNRKPGTPEISKLNAPPPPAKGKHPARMSLSKVVSKLDGFDSVDEVSKFTKLLAGDNRYTEAEENEIDIRVQIRLGELKEDDND